MRHEPIFLIVVLLLIPILVFVAPNVYAAKHLSNAQRYSDGYANGGQQASTDIQNHQPFNLTCDPTNRYTTGGGHTGIYCNGWTNGYTATWNNLVQANRGGPNGGTTHETQPGVNNIKSERYNIGFRDGAIQAKNDFNNGTKYSNLSCGLTLPQPMLAYCMGHFDGYKNQYIKLQGAAANVPTSNPPTTNVPTSNTTSNPPASNTTTPATLSSPTTYSWVGPFIIVVIVVILIAALVQKIRHRGGKYRERQDFSESVKEHTLNKQHHRCGHCNRLLNVVDYDHKDNDRSNNKESNCVALCPNCHAVKTRSTRKKFI